MDVFQQWIISLNGGAKSVIGAVIGACMGFDMGGPVNKTASMAANALGADGINGPMCAKLLRGITPPIGLFIATMIRKNKFNSKDSASHGTLLYHGGRPAFCRSRSRKVHSVQYGRFCCCGRHCSRHGL